MGDDLFTGLAHQECDEALGAGLVLTRLQDCSARDVDHPAGIAGREVGDGRVHIGGAHRVALPIPVVVVDDPDGHLAAVDHVRESLVGGVDVARRIDFHGL